MVHGLKRFHRQAPARRLHRQAAALAAAPHWLLLAASCRKIWHTGWLGLQTAPYFQHFFQYFKGLSRQRSIIGRRFEGSAAALSWVLLLAELAAHPSSFKFWEFWAERQGWPLATTALSAQKQEVTRDGTRIGSHGVLQR